MVASTLRTLRPRSAREGRVAQTDRSEVVLYSGRPHRARAAEVLGNGWFGGGIPATHSGDGPVCHATGTSHHSLSSSGPQCSRHSVQNPRANDVLVGHAHHDHVLDAPEVCRHTGARFIGGPDACQVARAAGLPETHSRPRRGVKIISGPGRPGDCLLSTEK